LTPLVTTCQHPAHSVEWRRGGDSISTLSENTVSNCKSAL